MARRTSGPRSRSTRAACPSRRRSTTATAVSRSAIWPPLRLKARRRLVNERRSPSMRAAAPTDGRSAGSAPPPGQARACHPDADLDLRSRRALGSLPVRGSQGLVAPPALPSRSRPGAPPEEPRRRRAACSWSCRRSPGRVATRSTTTATEPRICSTAARRSGASRVYSDDGLPVGFAAQEAPLFDWLDRHKHVFDLTTDLALARDAGALSRVQGRRPRR